MYVTIFIEANQWLMKVLPIGQGEEIKVSLKAVQSVQAARQMAIKALLSIPMYRDWAALNIQDLRARLQG